MKQILPLILLSIFLLGCSKEKQTKRNLIGQWEVARTDTHWSNGSNSNPSYIHQDNYATIELDKNGKGKMIVPDGVYYSNGNAYSYEGEIVDLEADIEQILLHYNTEWYSVESEYFNITWKWDKKTFVLSNGDIHYDDNTSSYGETKYTCVKKK
jgi:hypothetical protein